VKLTVTDDAGLTDTTTRTIVVDDPADPPTASFTISCLHLDCSVDATASAGTDSPIATYTWDFGDGPAADGAVNDVHTYGLDGTYTVTLTVTDGNGLTATASRTVSVVAAAQDISFLGESDRNTNAASWTVTVPSAVTAGDGLVLMASANSTSATLSPPSGGNWTLVSQRTAGSIITRVWQKVAGFGEGGTNVTLTAGSTIKVNVVLLAYRGTSSAGPVGSFAVNGETVTRLVHTTPSITTATPGSWVVSIWSDKSSLTNTIVGPLGQTQRYNGCSTGSGRICSLVTDSGPFPAGSTVGGLVATADAASSSDTMWTLLLAPAS